MWSIHHTVEYYSARKRKGVLVPPTTWINLENMMPNERSQTLKDKHCVIPLHEISEIGKFIETEN